MVALILLRVMNSENLIQIEEAKRRAALAALDLVQEGMVLGLGTGSTIKYFIEGLGGRCLNGLKVRGVATSNATARLAMAEKVPLLSLNKVEQIDLDVDGADQFDQDLNLIKGGGGALLREKIVAKASKRVVIIADETKRAENLGNTSLPVEVVPFSDQLILRWIEQLGYKGKIRVTNRGIPLVNDNQNHLIDVDIPTGVDLRSLDERLKEIPGVVETGLFLKMAHLVIMARFDGTTVQFQRRG